MFAALSTIPVAAVAMVAFVVALLIVVVLWALLSKSGNKSASGGAGYASAYPTYPQGYYAYPSVQAAKAEELKVGPAINVLAEQAEQIEKQINTTVGFLGRAQKWQGWLSSDAAAAVAPAHAGK